MSLDGRPQVAPPPPPAAALEVPAAPTGDSAAGAIPAAPPPASPQASPEGIRASAERLHFPVELEHIRHSYGQVLAVSDVSLRVPAGSIQGFIGPSGSGKTTTIRVILGMLRPSAGKVRVLGEDPRHFHRRTRERIGYMPQAFVLYPDLTAKENVNFVAATFGLLWRKRGRRVREVMELVGLWEKRDRRASDLSGGEQRRLELCCALAHEPALLVLDEPTAGVDPMLRQQIWTELERLRAAGVTLIVTTQYVTEAEYCDSVCLISRGQVVASASPAEVRRLALGGEVVEVVTRGPFDARRLTGIEGVVEIRQSSPVQMVVVADDVARATPRVIDAIAAGGGDVETTREFRPSFDEVFTSLVARHDAASDEQAGAAGGAPPSSLPVPPRKPR
jgi:ABC-2 type transport system ATP-binding protein